MGDLEQGKVRRRKTVVVRQTLHGVDVLGTRLWSGHASAEYGRKGKAPRHQGTKAARHTMETSILVLLPYRRI